MINFNCFATHQCFMRYRLGTVAINYFMNIIYVVDTFLHCLLRRSNLYPRQHLAFRGGTHPQPNMLHMGTGCPCCMNVVSFGFCVVTGFLVRARFLSVQITSKQMSRTMKKAKLFMVSSVRKKYKIKDCF